MGKKKNKNASKAKIDEVKKLKEKSIEVKIDQSSKTENIKEPAATESHSKLPPNSENQEDFDKSESFERDSWSSDFPNEGYEELQNKKLENLNLEDSSLHTANESYQEESSKSASSSSGKWTCTYQKGVVGEATKLQYESSSPLHIANESNQATSNKTTPSSSSKWTNKNKKRVVGEATTLQYESSSPQNSSCNFNKNGKKSSNNEEYVDAWRDVKSTNNEELDCRSDKKSTNNEEWDIGAQSTKSASKYSNVSHFNYLDANKGVDEVEKEYKAFEEYRKGKGPNKSTKIIEIDEDLFAMPEDNSLAHCVAEDLLMGSGIAVEFSRKFKRHAELYQQGEKQGGLAVLEDKKRFIYYLVTKKISTGKPTSYTMWRSLKRLQTHIKVNKVAKLAIPRLGCGLDRLEWSEVKAMLEFLFEDIDVIITVCNFQQNYGKTKEKLQQKSNKKTKDSKESKKKQGKKKK